jgi:hypothetical protein
MESEFSQYIGMPWAEGAVGPDAFDCMSFNRMVQREHFGIEMPVITVPDYGDSCSLVEMMRGHEERNNWLRVPSPQHGDMVLVHRPMHYGVWIDLDGGGVLHCVRGIGVCFTKDAVWRFSGFGRREYFRHVSKA